MGPADLAREHGLSAQAVRNYERDGFLPPAGRTPSGYRIYTETHAEALRAYVALIPAYGHAAAGQIMVAVHDDDLDTALLTIDRGHEQALRDRETLDAVRAATGAVQMTEPPRAAWSIGELGRRLRVTPATLRSWEAHGILVPSRDPRTGYRVFRAADVRDAELAHLLRRGGYPLGHIAGVLEQVRAAGGTAALAASLADWGRRLEGQGVARLRAAGRLGTYLETRSQ